jgi:3',5'-cyclic AMP phosphodiesterase CpdA
MVLNSNTQSAATHDLFIGQAIAANPDAVWKIVSFHHSLYSDASHTADADIVFRRSAYPPVFDKYGIDVVLSGHDHSYTRTYQMLGGLPVSRPGDSVMAVNPRGTLYMTLNSGSGSKFYALSAAYIVNGVTTYPAWTKVYWQQNESTFSNVTISNDTFSIVTYAVTAAASARIDGYTIIKSPITSVRQSQKFLKPSSVFSARPGRGVLQIEGVAGRAHLELFSISGARVRDLGWQMFSGGPAEVTMAKPLQPGVYLLRVAGSRNGSVRLVQP